MVRMQLLADLLRQDAACPRLTVYTERNGARLDFSATTLDNWAAKVANMLVEELDLSAGDAIAIDLPASWHAAVIALGAFAAEVNVQFVSGQSDAAQQEPAVVFIDPSRIDESFTERFDAADVVAVSDDPFGRGVTETGGTLPDGFLDFGPTVRMYPDQYAAPTPSLAAATNTPGFDPAHAKRTLCTGWDTVEAFFQQVFWPIAAGGSVVVVTGTNDPERLAHIADVEKVDA